MTRPARRAAKEAGPPRVRRPDRPTRQARRRRKRIATAANAQECLTYLENRGECSRVLVVSDLSMPEMDGIALLKVIQKRFPQVKVYICTAFDTPFLRKNSAEKGALRFFTKPLDFKALRSALLEDFAAEDGASGGVQ